MCCCCATSNWKCVTTTETVTTAQLDIGRPSCAGQCLFRLAMQACNACRPMSAAAVKVGNSSSTSSDGPEPKTAPKILLYLVSVDAPLTPILPAFSQQSVPAAHATRPQLALGAAHEECRCQHVAPACRYDVTHMQLDVADAATCPVLSVCQSLTSPAAAIPWSCLPLQANRL